MVGSNNEEKLKFKNQALKDWEIILLNRSKELISGGRFICINFGIDEKGRYLGNTDGHNMFDNFSKHWKNLEKEDVITNEEFINATFTQHYRTIEEFRKPFDDPNSEVSKSGLILKSCKTMFTDCPFKVYYNNNKSKISSNEYAKTLIPTMRSWSETVFKTALEKRDPEEINIILDQFYNSYIEEISNSPEGHAMDYIHIVMDIEKV